VLILKTWLFIPVLMVMTLIEHIGNKSPGRSKSPFYLNTVNSVLLKKISGRSPNRLSRHNRFPIAVDLDQRVWRDQEELPRPVLRPEPEFGRDRRDV
jgi:hypothetical protein